MTDDIEAWLNSLGLGHYVAVFSEHDINFDVLTELGDADLREMGLSLGHRKRVLKAIREIEPADHLDEKSNSAERRQLTVMFCDLVGSTKLSVRMDPEELREIISLFQRRCVSVAQSFGGNVARFMGDGLLVYFGYPSASENDPESAIYAGLQTISAIRDLDVGKDIKLQTRVGIATGEVVVGDLIGTDSAQERSVVGETPNLAARLQNLAEPDQVVVSNSTHKLVRGLFECQDLGKHALKGFDQRVRVWAVDHKSSIESKFEATHEIEKLAPLVSRERETERLLQCWSRVMSGTGQAVLVVGEPGIGKSRLVHMLRQQLAPVPHNLLRYFCAALFQHTALFPMIRQIESVAGFTGDDTDEAKLNRLEKLVKQGNNDPAELTPYLAALLSIPTHGRYPDLNLSPQRWLENTMRALELQLSGLARNRPVLVIFEDLHWIDPTTLELLERAVRKIAEMPVMLVMTARPEFEPPWQDAQDTSTIRLDRLDQDNTAALAAQLFDDRPLPDELVDLIVKKTDGVPLFIEEMTKMIIDMGLLEDNGDSLVLTGPLPDVALPSTLQDLLMARLDRLAGAKELAQVGATIGRRFAHELLGAVTNLRAEQVNAAMLKLLSADIVTAKGDAPNVIYTFKHALIQDSAYSSLLKDRRKSLHRSIAGVLEERSQDLTLVRPETLAHHYSRAGEHEAAIDQWNRAAILATEQAAHLDALEHVRNALEDLEALPDGPEKVRIEIGLRVTLGRNQEAVFGYASPMVEDTFARARNLCEMQEESADLVPVLLGICVNNLARGKNKTSCEISEQCVSISKETDQVDLLIESYAILNFALAFGGELLASQEVAEKCIDLYASRGREKFQPRTAQDPSVAVRSTASIVLWQLGFIDKSMEYLSGAIAMAEELGHPINTAQAYTHATAVHQLRGEHDQAVETARTCIQIASEHGYDYWQLLSTIHLGIAMGAQGDTYEALACATGALDILRASGADLNITYFLGGVGQIHRYAGEPEKGLLVLNQAIEIAPRMNETLYLDWLHILRGECYAELETPDYGAADADFVRAIEIASAQKARMLQLRANIRLFDLRRAQGSESTVREPLKCALEGIVGGAETTDLVQARALLGEST